MADINSFMNELTSSTFFGIPVILIIGILVFLFIILLKMKPKKSEHKRLDLAKEVRADLDTMYNTFGEPVKKNLMSGFVKIGYVIGQYPIKWDKYVSERTNMKPSKKLRQMVNDKTDKGENVERMTCLKYCGKTIFSKAAAKVLGKYKYMILPESKVKIQAKEVHVSPALQGFDFFGVMLFTKIGRSYIENIAFKISRSEELTEIADYIPKQNYLEMTTAADTIKKRETAAIEKEKYKGQIESASS